METRNNNYVQMAKQESNINQSGAKMSLLKTLKSKVLPKSYSPFLSSIVILSILSLANSTFAFPAKVKVNQNLYLVLFWAPHQRNSVEDYKTLKQWEIKNIQLINNTLVDVLYCRDDNWCYVSGYYSQGTMQQPVGYFSRRAWANSTELCDENNNDQTNPLPSCSSNSNGYDGIVASVNNFKRFFCDNEHDDKGNVVLNPWQWLFRDTNSNYCSFNSNSR